MRRLTRLSDDLCALSRAEEGRVELKLADVDLAQVAGRAADRLRAQAEDAGLGLTVTGVGPLQVQADADRMAQVVTNLVGNAIRATPQGGAITVASSIRGNNAVVQVSDTGEGLASDDLEKVFERFYRVPGRRRSRETGSGIGRPSARPGGTPERHLTAASDGPGRGATFTIAATARDPRTTGWCARRRSGLCGHSQQQRLVCRDPTRHQDFLVDHQAGSAHDPVAGDGGVVGDLLDGGVQPELVDGLAGLLLKVDAVRATGAEDLDVHVVSFGQG